jgi:hypothetical protein
MAERLTKDELARDQGKFYLLFLDLFESGYAAGILEMEDAGTEAQKCWDYTSEQTVSGRLEIISDDPNGQVRAMAMRAAWQAAMLRRAICAKRLMHKGGGQL